MEWAVLFSSSFPFPAGKSYSFVQGVFLSLLVFCIGYTPVHWIANQSGNSLLALHNSQVENA